MVNALIYVAMPGCSEQIADSDEHAVILHIKVMIAQKWLKKD